jgi:carbamoyl-phosphate synthase large subunit
MREYTKRLGLALGVRGLMNVQYALRDDVVYVLEVNPRASRTVPFVSKATGVPLAKIAAKVMVGRTLEGLGVTEEPVPPGYFVKESVFPFARFPGVDCLLGPEMKSTGEVMGCDASFGIAFAKAQQATGQMLPAGGTVFLSVNDNDKENIVPIARDLASLGFRLTATAGTAERLAAAGLPIQTIFKVNEGRPNVVDHVKNGDIDLLINTPLGKASYYDELAMRRTAYEFGVLAITTLSGARAAVEGIRGLREGIVQVRSIQEIHAAAVASQASAADRS